MKKTYIIENIEYTIIPCEAIALDDYTHQDALLVSSKQNGEKFDKVVFGYEMPETIEDFDDMCEDSSAWESDQEVLETVITIWYAVMADDEDDDWGTGSYDLDEAKEMVKKYPNGYIAVIKEGKSDSTCIDEIR